MEQPVEHAAPVSGNSQRDTRFDEEGRVELEERTCDVGGTRLRYRTTGSGPPARLVHGLAGSWRWWQGVVEPLAERHRLYLVDLPGFGSSRGAPFALGDAPSFLRALAAELHLERPHLVGHSLGGAVCARTAALWPEAVGRLVLAAPSGILERRRVGQYALPLVTAARHAQPSFLRVILADSLRAGVVTLYRAAAQYEAVLPDARLVVLEGVGHIPMAEQPAAFAAAVLDFLAAPTTWWNSGG